MKSTQDLFKYMRARGDADGRIDAPIDDPVMRQAERDGYAMLKDGYWQSRGIIHVGERRIVRFINGGAEEIIGTPEMVAELEREGRRQ